MPYVGQYVQKYAEHIMQLPNSTAHAPSLDLDQLPIIKQIRRQAPSTVSVSVRTQANLQCFPDIVVLLHRC